MFITPSTLSMLFQTWKGLYSEAYEKTEVFYDKLATKVPSTTLENVYPWLAMPKGFREWIGERMFNNLRVHGYVLRNKDWEDSVEIPRNAIKDDQYGVYSMFIQQMAAEAKKLYDELIASAMIAGATAVGFDGVAFFSASHPTYNGSGTYSNRATSTALTHTNYAAARAAMMSYVGEGGKSLRVRPNLLVVPPQLETTANQITNAEYTAPAAAVGANAANAMQTNVLRSTATVIVLPELSSTPGHWYLMDATKPVKPFILQEREAPKVHTPDEFTEHTFKTNHYIMGAEARAVAGYSLPFLCYRGEG